MYIQFIISSPLTSPYSLFFVLLEILKNTGSGLRLTGFKSCLSCNPVKKNLFISCLPIQNDEEQ